MVSVPVNGARARTMAYLVVALDDEHVLGNGRTLLVGEDARALCKGDGVVSLAPPQETCAQARLARTLSETQQ